MLDLVKVERLISNRVNVVGDFVRLENIGNGERLCYLNGRSKRKLEECIFTTPVFTVGTIVRVKYYHELDKNVSDWFSSKFGYSEKYAGRVGAISAIHSGHVPFLYTVTMRNGKECAFYSVELTEEL